MKEKRATTSAGRFADEEGSIALLTIGLFTLTVALLILITNVASISVAKQSLVHATEAAAIRATHNVDLELYYRGVSGFSVPIDCQAARQGVFSELDLWMQGDSDMRRPELQQIWVTDFTCSGDRISLSTVARASLPFRVPGSFSSFDIHASVEAQSERTR